MKIRCTFCKKEYNLKPCKVVRTKNPCCSRACSTKLKSSTMKGINNHQFGLRGELNASHKTDLKINQYGYVQVRALCHPFQDSSGMCFLHRLVFEEHLRETKRIDFLIPADGYVGLYLPPNYIVHHKDNNKLNNALDNLKLMTRAEHTAHHYPEIVADRCPESGRFLRGKKRGYLKRNCILDAGQDIKSAIDCVIKARTRMLIPTSLFVQISPGSVGLIWSRSGLSAKHGIEVGAGCIDSGYTGEVKVVLYNHSDLDFLISSGDRIAQLLTMEVNLNDYQDVEKFSNSTKRSESGFGSTGA